MSEAERHLREHQQQLDAHGTMVGVSRQAVVEVLAELATLKEKARAAVDAPYEDVLDMGLAQALRELEEALPQETKDARPSYDERVDEWKEMHRSDGE